MSLSFSAFFDDRDDQIHLMLRARLSTTEKVKQRFGCAIAIYYNENLPPFITESVWGNKKPEFQTKFSIIPRINNSQTFNVVLLEMTPTIKPVDEYKKIGETKVSLGKILIEGKTTLTLDNAEIDISVHQESSGRGVLSMIIAFYKLPLDHWLIKNYPELQILKYDENIKDWASIYSSECVKRSDVGQWAPILLPCRLVCEDDYNREIKLVVINAEPGKEKYPIGYCHMTIKEISECRNKKIVLIPADPKKARAGNLIIRAATLIERSTFYGHIKNGLRFNFACAIDFNISNRPPRDSKSLHYTTVGEMNPYQTCMTEIYSAIEPYCDGRSFHAWGFAAKYKRVLNHCFPLVTHDGSPELNSIRDLQNSYWAIFEFIQFDKPVMICPATQMAINQVKGSKNPADYLVFLILIERVPDDFGDFVDLLYDNQHEPISIVIMGIGEYNFSQFEEYFVPGSFIKNSQGKPFEREFVVFVKYNTISNISQLTSTALLCVPEQAIHWVEVSTL